MEDIRDVQCLLSNAECTNLSQDSNSSSQRLGNLEAGKVYFKDKTFLEWLPKPVHPHFVGEDFADPRSDTGRAVHEWALRWLPCRLLRVKCPEFGSQPQEGGVAPLYALKSVLPIEGLRKQPQSSRLGPLNRSVSAAGFCQNCTFNLHSIAYLTLIQG